MVAVVKAEKQPKVGNICSERVRLGRALQKPPLSQKGLSIKLELLGINLSAVMISKIENNQRQVTDAELLAISKALKVPMEWLVGETDDFNKILKMR